MNSIQEKVDELIKKYNLESSVEIRFIDLISELGELGKEILKGNEYGKKVFCNTENLESEIGFDATITGFDIPQLDLILNPEVLDVVKDASKKDSDTEFLENVIDIPKRVQKGDL